MISRRRFLAACTLAAACGRPAPEVDERSAFAHIRVRREGSVRSLRFVTDDGREIIESLVDLDAPHVLLSPYASFMFAGMLMVPRPQRVLLVGLGGGAMVHFLRVHHPQATIDAVEIDPAVVRLAKSHFGIVESGPVRIHIADVFDFIQRSGDRYDTIYMDAFLPPSRGTDPGGTPLRVKTLDFYADLRRHLEPGGIVTFNAIDHDSLPFDIATITEAFATPLVFAVPGSRNHVIVTGHTAAPDEATLVAAADELDRQHELGFSFHELLGHWTAASEALAHRSTFDRARAWLGE